MALSKLEASLDIISALGTNPGSDNDLNEEQLKGKFDEAANIIKDYLNNYLIPEMEKTVDVEALLSDILDVTLSQNDKAANAAAAGNAVRSLRSLLDIAVLGGNCVLEYGGGFAADVPDSLTIRIQNGAGVIQGNLFALEAEDIELKEGTYGLKRNDLIVVRCNRSDDNLLSYSFAVLNGDNTSGEPVDPVHQQEDINSDGKVRDFPIYRIRFDGMSVSQIEPLFIVASPAVKTKRIPRILAATGWSASAPYTQAVAVPGLTDEKQAMAYPDVPEDASQEAEFMEEVGKITSCRRSGSVMTFRCLDDKPTLDIPVIVEVYV